MTGCCAFGSMINANHNVYVQIYDRVFDVSYPAKCVALESRK